VTSSWFFLSTLVNYYYYWFILIFLLYLHLFVFTVDPSDRAV